MDNQSNLIIYQYKDGQIDFKAPLEKESAWLTQKQMGGFFGKDIKTINQHIRDICDEGGIDRISTISESKIAQKEGDRAIVRKVKLISNLIGHDGEEL